MMLFPLVCVGIVLTLIAVMITRIYCLAKDAFEQEAEDRKTQFKINIQNARDAFRHNESVDIVPDQFINEYISSLFEDNPSLASSQFQAQSWVSKIDVPTHKQSASVEFPLHKTSVIHLDEWIKFGLDEPLNESQSKRTNTASEQDSGKAG